MIIKDYHELFVSRMIKDDRGSSMIFNGDQGLSTIMKDYQIRFNVRTDLTEELRETFSKRYIKYIV